MINFTDATGLCTIAPSGVLIGLYCIVPPELYEYAGLVDACFSNSYPL